MRKDDDEERQRRRLVSRYGDLVSRYTRWAYSCVLFSITVILFYITLGEMTLAYVARLGGP